MNSFNNTARNDLTEGTDSQDLQVTAGEEVDQNVIWSTTHGDQLKSPLLSSRADLHTQYWREKVTSSKHLSTKGHATILSTMVNILNKIVGGGMLGLPYAFANSGVQMSAVWFMITGFGGAYAIHLLAKCVIKEKMFSFRALGKNTLKFNGKEHFVNGILAINCFGNCCGYLVVIPDIYRDLTHPTKDSLLVSATFWVTIVV